MGGSHLTRHNIGEREVNVMKQAKLKGVNNTINRHCFTNAQVFSIRKTADNHYKFQQFCDVMK